MLLRVGSRGSRLALTQATLAAERLRRPGVEVALVPITTAGDRDRTKPFGEIGARGVFVKEIEEALLGGRIDVAVHSAKDMTSTDTDGLAVGAYLEREDPRDALCGAAEIRPGMRIGTASVRRRAAAARARADALGRAAARQRRHAPAQAWRARAGRGRARCVRARPARPLARDRAADRPGARCFRRPAQGALALQVRAGEEELVAGGRPRRDAAARRGRAARGLPASAAAASRRSRPSTTARR